MLDELTALFVEKGMLELTEEGSYLWVASSDAPLVVPEDVAQAMWNYKFVTYDGSNGVHNSAYAKALLEAALESMNAYTP
jgi:hypothetical protein